MNHKKRSKTKRHIDTTPKKLKCGCCVEKGVYPKDKIVRRIKLEKLLKKDCPDINVVV